VNEERHTGETFVIWKYCQTILNSFYKVRGLLISVFAPKLQKRSEKCSPMFSSPKFPSIWNLIPLVANNSDIDRERLEQVAKFNVQTFDFFYRIFMFDYLQTAERCIKSKLHSIFLSFQMIVTFSFKLVWGIYYFLTLHHNNPCFIIYFVNHLI